MEDYEFVENENPTCPMCGGNTNYLGTLGAHDVFRCEDCGWDVSQPIVSDEDEEEPETINPDYILSMVQRGLVAQFQMYSWSDMIDDIPDLTDSEKEWAKSHVDYTAILL